MYSTCLMKILKKSFSVISYMKYDYVIVYK